MNQQLTPPPANASAPLIRYHDRTFRVIAIFLVALFVTSYGGEGLFKVLLTPAFYFELLVTLLFTAILVEWISFVTRKLDKTFDWERKSIQRLILQVAVGIIVPGIFEFILAAAYFRYFGINILDTTFPNFAFPLIMVLIAVFNLYYFSFFIFLRWRQAQKSLGRLAGQLRNVSHQPEVDYFKVSYGGEQLAVPTEDFLYFYRDGKNNYARTVRGETYIIPQTLDELEEMLNQGTFFRLNRQVIANFACCKGYSEAGYGKLQVELSPQFPVEGPVIISQRKAPKFKGWMEKVKGH